MIDTKELTAVVVKIRRIRDLSTSLIANPAADAERISLDGEIQAWFNHHRGDLLRAAQTEVRLLNLLGPIVAAAMNSLALNSIAEQVQSPEEQLPALPPRKGASLTGENAKAEAVLAARAAAAAGKGGDPEHEAKVEKMRVASDRASAQSNRLADLGCTPVVRKGDLSDTVAGEPNSMVTL